MSLHRPSCSSSTLLSAPSIAESTVEHQSREKICVNEEVENGGMDYHFLQKRTENSTVCEVEVNRKLLDHPRSWISTHWFRFCNRDWKLHLVHEPSGYLAVCIYTGELPPRDKTRFCASLFNHRDGQPKMIRCDEDGCFRNFCLTRMITDPLGGFLKNDRFTLQFNMRTCLPTNEWQFQTAGDCSATITWKFKALEAIDPHKLKSQAFAIEDTQWQLLFYPFDCKTKGDKASVYLCSLDKSGMQAKYRITIVNHYRLKDSIVKGGEMQPKKTKIAGAKDIIDTDWIRDPASNFVLDGWFVIKVEVTIPELQRAQSCSKCGGADRTFGVRHRDLEHVCMCEDCMDAFKMQDHTCCPVCQIELMEGEFECFQAV